MPRKSPDVRLLAAIAGIALASAALAAAPPAIKTPGEDCGYTRYTQNGDIGRFLSLTDALSKELSVQVVGRTKDVD